MVVPGGLSFQSGFPGGELFYSPLLPRRNGGKYSQAGTPVLHTLTSTNSIDVAYAQNISQNS